MAIPTKLLPRIVNPDTSILTALKQMDECGVKSLVVVRSESQFIGILSIGDIQRAIIRNDSLDLSISHIIRNNPRVGWEGMSMQEIETLMLKHRMEILPIINENKEIISCFFWEDFFTKNLVKPLEIIDLPVVIMAGGFGTRMKPLTNVLPKALIPIGEKSMLEEIFERFSVYGCNDFYVSVNYKADFIEYYISQQRLPYEIEFFREPKPLGTAGSLSLLKNKIKKTFFVSNCDILIEQDFSEILNYHKNNNNEITIIAALMHYPIPYGTIETGINGKLLKLTEKPELTFKINSGMYVLEPHLLSEIPSNTFYHITTLINKVLERNGRVGVFPVSQQSWSDIGDWREYLNHLRK